MNSSWQDETRNTFDFTEQEADFSSYITDSDYQAQQKIDKIMKRTRVYGVIALVAFLATFVFAIINDDRHPFGVEYYLLGIGVFVLFFAFCIIATYRKSKVFKKEIVEPVLVQKLGCNLSASDYFKRKAPLAKIFKKMQIGRYSSAMNISDCIAGRIKMTKYVFIDFTLSHSTGGKHSHTITDFRGQAIIAPVKNMTVIPFDYRPEVALQKKASLFQKLRDEFNESWKSGTQEQFGYSSFSPASGMDQKNASFDNNFSSETSNPLYQIISMYHKQEMKIQFHCVEEMFIWIIEDDVDLFESQRTDNIKQLGKIKKRIIEESNWVKSQVEALIKTGVI